MNLIKNHFGYYEISPKPKPDYLKSYYNNKYFGNPETRNQFSYNYTDEELAHKNIAGDEAIHYVPNKGRRLFEIGFGEGFFIRYFHKRGWVVKGVDFTDEGLMKYHPELKNQVIVGDLFEIIDDVLGGGEKYDLVACNNILEHVVNPCELLGKIKSLLTDDGVCRIVVPNDGSLLQHEIVRRGYAESNFWVRSPDHLNYFTIASLKEILCHMGFQILDLLADFPIDLFLFNADSNYQRNDAQGRNCHFARVMFETTLHKQSLNTLIEFRRGCARAGVGRDIIVYCKKAEEAAK